MYTVIQLVVGMPGENDQTVAETIEFAKAATEGMDEPPIERLSINLFQALPGTPGYEFMRSKGVIGDTIEEEEAYLLKISDVDASSQEHYVNVSEEPLDKVMLWQKQILREATINYYKKRGWKPWTPPAHVQHLVKDYARGGYFRIVKIGLINSIWYWRFEDTFRTPLRWFRLLRSRLSVYGAAKGLAIHFGLAPSPDRSKFFVGDKSLRQQVKLVPRENASLSEINMIPLRAGR